MKCARPYLFISIAMKRDYLILPILFACAGLYGENVTLVGGTSAAGRVAFPSTYNNTTVLTLAAQEAGGTAYYDAAGRTVNQLNVNSSSSVSVDITGGFTIDTNASSATAINFGQIGATSTFTFGGDSTYTLKSSAADASSASFDIKMLAGAITESTLVLESGSTLESFGKITYLGNGNGINSLTEASSGIRVEGTFNIYSSDDRSSYGDYIMTWHYNPSPVVGSRSMTKIADGGVMNVRNLEVGRNSFFEVSSGGVLNVTGRLNIPTTKDGSTGTYLPEGIFKVDAGGKANLGSVELYGAVGNAFIVAGTVTADYFVEERPTTNNVGFVVEQGGDFTVGTYYLTGGYANMGGKMTVTERFSIGGIYQSKFTVLSTGELYTNGVDMMSEDGATFNLRIEGYHKNVGDIAIYSQLDSAALSIAGYAVLDTDSLSLNGASVDISGTLNVQNIIINADQYVNSKLKLWEWGVLNINGTSTLTDTINTGVVNVNAGITRIASASGFLLQGGTLNIKDGARMEAVEIHDGNNPYVFRVQTSAESKVNIYGTGVLDLSKTYGSNDLAIDWNATLSVYAENKHSIIADKVTFFNGAKLNINSENIFIGETGTYSTFIMLAADAKAYMNVNYETHFSYAQLQSNAVFTINVAQNADAVLIFDKLLQYSNHVGSIVFDDFNNEKVFFQSMSELPDYITFSGTGVNGVSLTNSDFELIAGNFNGTEGWWMYSPLVPEPAEWAFIFGLAAAVFALKRRLGGRI